MLTDVKEWLVTTEGGVRLAVLFKIEEGRVPGKTIEQLEGVGGFDGGDDQDGEEVEEKEEEEEEEESDVASDPKQYYRRIDNMVNEADHDN